MPTVSVIIPTYNRALMVKEAIQSVLAQTYMDYEIIVVDDGSTDNTKATVGTFQDKVKYVYQQNNGCSSARNYGIQLAQGKYVAFLDSDDIFVPTKLQKQVALMESNPRIVLSHTSYERITVDGKYIGKVRSGTFTGKVYPKIMVDCPIATSTVMVRREALGGNIKFDETLSFFEDNVLWMELAKKSRILGIDEPLSKIRISESTATFNRKAMLFGLTNIVERMIEQDTELSPLARRTLLSHVYLEIGFIHFREHETSLFLKFLFRSFWNNPISTALALSAGIYRVISRRAKPTLDAAKP